MEEKIPFDKIWKRLGQLRGLIHEMPSFGSYVFTYNSYINKIQMLTDLDGQEEEVGLEDIKRVYEDIDQIMWAIFNLENKDLYETYPKRDIYIASMIRYALKSFN